MQIEVIDYCDPMSYLYKLPLTNLVFLDSAKKHSTLGRYSYIAIDPFNIIKYSLSDHNQENIFTKIQEQINQHKTQNIKELPPFQGGLAGYFSYDIFKLLENIKTNPKKKSNIPLYQLGCYDLIISFDHFQKKAWAISTGSPIIENYSKEQRAKKRMKWLLKNINTMDDNSYNSTFISELKCNFNFYTYTNAIKKVKNYILNGDIFQANISRCYETFLNEESNLIDLYKHLRLINPAPFASYLNFPECTILSSSPERFIKLSENKVETRPIKGTAARSYDPREDQINAQRLVNNTKDRAENTMIVDLMRNDLSKVCLAQSIEVPQYCELESFETVHHLVSVITGTLKPNFSAIDLFSSTFPGGSITGAPKIRAMEIIEEIEPISRGPYCGAIGYIGFNNQMDTSITIRSYVSHKNKLSFHTGGAITLNSDPEEEFFETEAKAKALKQALVEVL